MQTLGLMEVMIELLLAFSPIMVAIGIVFGIFWFIIKLTQGSFISEPKKSHSDIADAYANSEQENEDSFEPLCHFFEKNFDLEAKRLCDSCATKMEQRDLFCYNCGEGKTLEITA